MPDIMETSGEEERDKMAIKLSLRLKWLKRARKIAIKQYLRLKCFLTLQVYFRRLDRCGNLGDDYCLTNVERLDIKIINNSFYFKNFYNKNYLYDREILNIIFLLLVYITNTWKKFIKELQQKNIYFGTYIYHILQLIFTWQDFSHLILLQILKKAHLV